MSSLALAEPIPPSLPVALDEPVRLVAAIIAREGRYLITKRRPTAVLPGLWEFPGGRVESGESDRQALVREALERVGLGIEVGPLVGQRVHKYDGYVVQMVLYKTSILDRGEPRALRVAEFAWVLPEEIERYPFPPADQETMDLILGVQR